MTFGACHKSPHSQSRVTASSATTDLACHGYITQYGSTVYIGMAMGGSAL